METLDRVVTGMQPRAVLSLTPFSTQERELLAHRDIMAIDPSTTARSDLNHEIGALQAQHLAERGHRRLAYAHLRDARQDPFGRGREQGFREACAALPVELIGVVGLDVDPVAARAALEELGQPGIGVACYNDDVATALLYAAAAAGWRVPEDLAVIGMDHTPLSAVTTPPLTTIDYDTASSAQAAIDSILVQLGITERDATDDVPEVGLRLIARATT
ncbi:substrate-binding domain-containing protein [Agrococcus sp. UYP10]|uniref:substrate-binding domain-containing protein n=1 Tax=Agrococcus sp. UYP10 TaxID=1756355 RepID=UPI00339672E4